MLTLWGRKNSFNVQKVIWALEELELPYRWVDAGGAAGGLDNPEFRTMNPHGRVPVLRHDDLVLWESNTIVRYLGAAFNRDDSLWSSDPAERAKLERWMDWAIADLARDFLTLFWLQVRTPTAQQDAAAIAAATARTHFSLSMVEKELETRRYLAADRFTLGDIPAATCLYRYFEMSIDRPELPNVARWYADITARPAYRTGVMVPFDDLYGRLAF